MLNMRQSKSTITSILRYCSIHDSHTELIVMEKCTTPIVLHVLHIYKQGNKQEHKTS